MRAELRGFMRFNPKKDVKVALIYPPQEAQNNVTGSLIDISRCGLAFSYLPFKTQAASTGKSFTVFLLGSHMPTEPIRCRKVYEVDFHDKSRSLPPAKRVGLEFLAPLSASELQAVIS